MKNLLLFTVMLSGVGASLAQDSLTTPKAKHQIGISFYQPFRIDEPQGAGQLPPDIVLMFDGSELKGTRFGAGLDYTYNFKNGKDFCFFKLGFTDRKSVV